MLSSAKFSVTDLHKKLESKGWRGRSYGYRNTVTYLTESNKTIATVEFDAKKSLIISANFE